MRVETTGRWRVAIEEQVDTPLAEPPLPAMRLANELRRAKFYGVEKKGKGTAALLRLDNGRLGLRLEDFATTSNTDLFVWLSDARHPRTSRDAFEAPHRVLAALRSTRGDQNYLLPPDTQASKVRSIVIWGRPLRIAYAAAALGTSGR